MSGHALQSGLGDVGASLRGWRADDVPGDTWGPARTAFADVLEDADGMGFLVQLAASGEEQVPIDHVMVRVVGQDREPVAGRAPFADDAGHFAAVAPMTDDQTSFYVAWGALDEPPPELHVIVQFVAGGQVVGHTAFDLASQAAEPLTQVLYARPVGQMAIAVAEAGGGMTDAAQEAVRVQLRSLFSFSDDDLDAMEALLAGPMPSLRRLAVAVGCRYPDLDAEELFFALLGIAASGGDTAAAAPEKLEVVAAVARHLEVPEKAWRRWAYRMGVDLPRPKREPAPSRVQVAREEGRRLVPSVILRLDPEGQDRRNPAASLSLLTGIATVVLMFASLLAAVTPISMWLLVLLLPTQCLLAAVAIGSGVFAWRKGAALEGAGQGAALTGISLGVVYFVIVAVLLTALCLGVGTTAVLEQVYDF